MSRLPLPTPPSDPTPTAPEPAPTALPSPPLSTGSHDIRGLPPPPPATIVSRGSNGSGPSFKLPPFQRWHLYVLLGAAAALAGWYVLPGLWTETVYRRPSQEWSRAAAAEELPGRIPAGGALDFQIDKVETARVEAGQAAVYVSGTAKVRDPLFQRANTGDLSTDAGVNFGELGAAQTEAKTLDWNIGTRPWQPEVLANTVYLRETTPAGKSAPFRLDFHAQRMGTRWNVSRVARAITIPADAFTGLPRAAAGPANALIVGSEEANKRLATQVSQVQRYIEAVETEKKAEYAARHTASTARSQPAPAQPSTQDDAPPRTPVAAATPPATPAAVAPPAAAGSGPRAGQRWQNSLGMRFTPVPGLNTLFAVWTTRVQDFAVFARETNYDPGDGMISLAADGWKQRGDNWQHPGFNQGLTHPVVGVNWDTANAFCAWLTAREQQAGTLGTDQRYRLPSDREWSRAVGLSEEAGATPKERNGRVPGVYPWGMQWPPPSGAGNYRGMESKIGQEPAKWSMIAGYYDPFPRTAPVGSFKSNPYGLYDMSGNVWQWTSDLLAPGQANRVVRGGSWRNDKPADLLSSKREDCAPDGQDCIVGFRCVLDVGDRPF